MTTNQVLSDICLAKQLISTNSQYPNKNAQVPNYFLNLYPFTNENLTGCLQNFNIPNRCILTLGSSADHALNFISQGSPDITLLDLNPFVKYYYDLKVAAIHTLSRDAFLDFFSRPAFSFPEPSNNCFNEKDYSKLSLSLPKDSKLFWDTLFNTYSNKFLKKHLFMKEELPKKMLIKNNPYLATDNYHRLPSQLAKTNLLFLQDNILNLTNLSATYDIIYLSNVFDYIFSFRFTKLPSGNYEMHSSVAKEYLNFLKQVITKLNPHGHLFFHYMWDIYNNNYQYYSSLDKILAPHDDITKLTFPGSNHFRDEQDSIYVYTKKLK